AKPASPVRIRVPPPFQMRLAVLADRAYVFSNVSRPRLREFPTPFFVRSTFSLRGWSYDLGFPDGVSLF
ncbi:MAG: hypothetical protein P8R38_04065, partial [Planctomycetota bacterium]|nr:hypothetical protein [Planctomycetota bacterium]